MLPSEIHGEIRKFGYNPMISDQELYHLIQELDPYYSLTDLAQRYNLWLNEWRVTNPKWMIDFPKSFISKYDSIMGPEVINLTDILDFEKEGDWYYAHGKESFDALINAIEVRKIYDRCPLNPAVVRGIPDYWIYYHSRSYRFSYKEPINYEALAFLQDHPFYDPIRDDYVTFSLQKEYTRLQRLYNLKKRPHILDKLLDQIGDSLVAITNTTIYYDDPELEISTEGLPIKDQGEDFIQLDMNIDMDLVAKLWDGISYSTIISGDKYVTITPTKWSSIV